MLPLNDSRQTESATEPGIELSHYRTPVVNVNKTTRTYQAGQPKDNLVNLEDEELAIIALLEGDPIELGLFSEQSPAYLMWISLQMQNNSMTNLRARRVLESNRRLRADLNRKRGLASNSCLQLIRYTQENVDRLIPQVDGYIDYENGKDDSRDSIGCCVVS